MHKFDTHFHICLKCGFQKECVNGSCEGKGIGHTCDGTTVLSAAAVPKTTAA